MTGQETSPLKNTHDSGSGPWAHSLHLATLFGFAVAQPLFDQIGQHPEFLVAQGIGRAGRLPFSLGLALALPLCAWGALVLLNTLSRQLETAVAVSSVGFLSGLLALQVFSRTITAPGPLLVTEAVGVGVGVGWFYLRVPGLRYFLTALSPSLFIFPAVFLLGSPLLNRGSDPGGILGVGTSTPVVMVVFDELPAISLLGPEGQIDPVRYPNLAALTREAHWFRNASTVSEGTLISVPAILGGLYPKPGSNRLPIWSDHPRSLFTLLRDSHHLNIHENITRLAPPGASTRKLNPAILLSRSKTDFPAPATSLRSVRSVAPNNRVLERFRGGRRKRDRQNGPTSRRTGWSGESNLRILFTPSRSWTARDFTFSTRCFPMPAGDTCLMEGFTQCTRSRGSRG